jgi:alkylated DNA nucleotide flippase Atl1
VTTYGQVAELAGFPRAARLTVWALQSAEDLPWHRVVGAGGRIALPGAGGQEQRLRLELEGVSFRGGRVRMDLHTWSPVNRRNRPYGRGGSASRRRLTHARHYEGWNEKGPPPWEEESEG